MRRTGAAAAALVLAGAGVAGTADDAPVRDRFRFWMLLLWGADALLGTARLVAGGWMDEPVVQAWRTVCLAITVQAVPFLLLGTALSGAPTPLPRMRRGLLEHGPAAHRRRGRLWPGRRRPDREMNGPMADVAECLGIPAAGTGPCDRCGFCRATGRRAETTCVVFTAGAHCSDGHRLRSGHRRLRTGAATGAVAPVGQRRPPLRQPRADHHAGTVGGEDGPAAQRLASQAYAPGVPGGERGVRGGRSDAAAGRASRPGHRLLAQPGGRNAGAGEPAARRARPAAARCGAPSLPCGSSRVGGQRPRPHRPARDGRRYRPRRRARAAPLADWHA